jgi:hypothetical protein
MNLFPYPGPSKQNRKLKTETNERTNDTTKKTMTNDGYLQAPQTGPNHSNEKLTINPNLSPPFCVSLLTLAYSRTKVVTSLSCNPTSHFCLPSMITIRKWDNERQSLMQNRKFVVRCSSSSSGVQINPRLCSFLFLSLQEGRLKLRICSPKASSLRSS